MINVSKKKKKDLKLCSKKEIRNKLKIKNSKLNFSGNVIFFCVYVQNNFLVNFQFFSSLKFSYFFKIFGT